MVEATTKQVVEMKSWDNPLNYWIRRNGKWVVNPKYR